MPNAKLDKTYNPQLFEKIVYEKSAWAFKPSDDKSKETYCTLMPPPNVTGVLHIGHALTYTLPDILVRYHRQRGKRVLWQAGVDHAGIATQMVVERMLAEKGIHRSDMSREEFIDEVMKWKEQSGTTIVEQQKALGCSADWDSSRFTMDPGFVEAVTEAFVRLYDDGLIYRAKRLVNWDTKFKTAISDLEIINKEEKGTLWHINYRLEGDGGHITVATTRPETMFGDVAVAVHPEDHRYRDLIGKFVLIPYSNKRIPIIADEHADKDKGSGAVKITPAHDYNDFEVGKRHSLPYVVILDEDGHMEKTDDVPDFLQGLYVKKARKVVLEKLKEDGLLLKEESIVHSVPYGDRSNVVVEPMLKDQWFVDSKTLSKKALEAVENGDTKIIPEKWENTYFEWLRNIQDWCISRQIVWGHQIPAWYDNSGNIIVARDEAEMADKAKKQGLDPNGFDRDRDVLDTWFSSSLWPFATLGWPHETDRLKEFYPTSVLVTGFDIIFFWVARMMMMSLYFMKDIPFKDIYLHSLVRDEKGQKMSKSKGNVIDPMVLMDEFGADALRFSLAFLTAPGSDIKFGKDNVKIARNFITKIWNAARFLEMRNVQFDKTLTDLKIDTHLKKWILTKLKKFQQDIDQNISDYRFDYVTRNIQYFVRDNYCDFFVEAVKIIDTDDVKDVAGYVFGEFLRIIHPVVPFASDHLYQTLIKDESLTIKSPTSINDIEIFEDSESLVDGFVEKVHAMRSLKRTGAENSDEYKQIESTLPKESDELFILNQMIK